MSTVRWKQGTAGNWFTSSNWTPQSIPTTGDTVVIVSGMPTIAGGSPAIIGEQIVLGGFAPATLVATNAILAGTAGTKDEVNVTLTAVGGEPTSPATSVVLRAEGATSFDGQIFVNVLNGSLVIEALSDGVSPGTFTIRNTDLKATVLVNQESQLSLNAGTIINGGLIQVEGVAEIASGVTVAGTGIFELDDGGRLMVRGTVDAGQQIDLMDKTPFVTLAAGSRFDGVFGFTQEGGARIDLASVQAQSAQLVEGLSGQPDTLNLFSGAGGTGTIVARLNVQLVDAGLFPSTQQTLTGNDFAISSNGAGGTLVRYAPQGPTFLDQSLAVPITAPVGSRVSLGSILKQSFGTETLGFKSYTLLPSQAFANSTTDIGYWSSSNVTPTWYLNGIAVTTATKVQLGDLVELLVGNQINNPARFQVQVTDASSGPSAEYVNYTAWSVAPEIAGAMTAAGFSAGAATPAAVVASANTYAATYGLINNTNLCNWIADNVGAGAGATLPPDSISLDPLLNLEGGFWRIAYAAGGPPSSTNWSSLVQPGDIVRMGWFKPEEPTTEHVSGHTTTVLGAVDAAGQITVYDNIDFVDGVEYIGTHTASYWVATNPADITIYRLDPKHQFLIQGTALAEVLQGSVYDNLIRSGGGADVITLGATDSQVEGTVAQLKVLTITDFNRGDVLSFTDLAATNASAAYQAGELHVRSNGQEVAAVTMPMAGPAEVFTLLPQPDGGSFVSLAFDPVAQIEALYVGYLARGGDPAGAIYWQEQLSNDGGGLEAWRSLAASYATQAETRTLYPFFVDPSHATAAQRIAFVNSVYQVLFNRSADPAGLEYWQDYLARNAGNAQKVGTIILDIIEGVSHSSGSTDLLTVDNKVTVSTFFTQQLAAAHLAYDAAAAALAHSTVSQTTSSAASVTAAQASITAFINSHSSTVSVTDVVGIVQDAAS
jgi:hypothetical protein